MGKLLTTHCEEGYGLLEVAGRTVKASDYNADAHQKRNHEEERGHAISPIAAALILADKADVHRSRVHSTDPATFDIHDRVNFAATHSFLRVVPETKRITLEITIDTSIAAVMDYFEIFLSRMIMCRRAAEFLGCRFGLEINQIMLV